MSRVLVFDDRRWGLVGSARDPGSVCSVVGSKTSVVFDVIAWRTNQTTEWEETSRSHRSMDSRKGMKDPIRDVLETRNLQ